MRLVTYDRGGARRLGAWVGDSLVDLPDAVGHPAFPATLEGLVTRSRGGAMEAARAALANPAYVEEALVPAPRLLAPLVLFAEQRGTEVGHDGVLAWPDGTTCHWQPQIACVLGNGGRKVSPAEASELIFGYLLVSSWTSADGDRPRAASAFGPCVVTALEFDPAEITLTARVNRGVWARERIGDARGRFAATIARASREREVLPGEVFSSSPFDAPVLGDGHRPLTRDATVEIDAGPLGVLRTRVRFRGERAPAASRKS
jgi:2-keto-4-pentenoate hydratase/2-oxohepta-3-ene-1,7-dioic acid hydratase in catechol pathway